MRHQRHGRKFGRTSKIRRAMLKCLITDLILYEKIKTTKQKAKEIKGMVDKTINLGKSDKLNKKQLLDKYLTSKNAVEKTIKVLSKKFIDRNSGYSKMYPLQNRAGDNAQMVIIELILPKKIEKKEIKSTITKVETKKSLKPKKEKTWFDKAKDFTHIGKKNNAGAKVTVAPRTTSK